MEHRCTSAPLLGPGTFSALDLAFCGVRLAFHLEWSVLFYGNYCFRVNLHMTTPSRHVSRHRKWIDSLANCGGFSQSLISRTRNFVLWTPMLEYFTSTVLRAAYRYIPASCSTLTGTPVPWWTQECHEAIRSRRRAQRYFLAQPTMLILVLFKRFRAKAQQVICMPSRHHGMAPPICTFGCGKEQHKAYIRYVKSNRHT
jgi:hypothetical protein